MEDNESKQEGCERPPSLETLRLVQLEHINESWMAFPKSLRRECALDSSEYHPLIAAAKRIVKHAEKAEAERDQYRKLIEENNRRCEIGCRREHDRVNCGVAECGRCPRRYLIELPEAKP